MKTMLATLFIATLTLTYRVALAQDAPPTALPAPEEAAVPGVAPRPAATEPAGTEVVPEVERTYRVSRDRSSRAIAGLSMGGAESLHVGLNALNRFAWIGAFSSGGLGEDFYAVFPALDSKANEQLRLLWISCGKEDRLIDANRKFLDWLKSKGIRHTGLETPGAHTWMVWRRNLAEFASLLFQEKSL